MAANTNPIFGRTPDVQLSGSLNSGTILGPTAVTAQDGTGSLVPIFQADATEGGNVKRIIMKSVGSPAATVARLFMCTATGAFTSGTTNTATNTVMIDELSLATVTTSNTVAQTSLMFNLTNFVMPAGWRLLIGFGTSTGAAGTGYVTMTEATKY